MLELKDDVGTHARSDRSLASGLAGSLIMTQERRRCLCCCRRRSRAFEHRDASEQPYFTVTVVDPDTGANQRFFAKADEPELTLAHVMNLIAFDATQGDPFDANFISFYNAATDDVDYYVQRLISIPVTDEHDPSRGAFWHVYINEVIEDWMEVMRRNRIVCKEDSIVWRFHLVR